MGQVTGSNHTRPSDRRVQPARFVNVAANNNCTTAIDEHGNIWACGQHDPHTPTPLEWGCHAHSDGVTSATLDRFGHLHAGGDNGQLLEYDHLVEPGGSQLPIVWNDTAKTVTGSHTSTLCVLLDGRLLIRGNNPFGQTAMTRWAWRDSGLENIASAASGARGTVAISNDGTIRGTRRLGDQWTTSHLSGGVAVSVGGHHTLIVDKDGRVWGSGDNYNGQLGDGTTKTPPGWTSGTLRFGSKVR